MGIYFRMGITTIPLIQAESLPSLCSQNRCLRDRISGEQFCEKHKHIRRLKLDRRSHRDQLISKITVYFMSSGNLIKIGRTKNIKKRLKSISHGSPVNVNLEAHIEAWDTLETELHNHFQLNRSHGEWFKRNSELESIIDFARNKDIKSIAETIGSTYEV